MTTFNKQKTFIPKPEDIKRNAYLIDATDQVLGKVAVKAATILRGKHKAIFTPHLDTGDTVIIVNSEKIRVTGKKNIKKIYFRYSGYPGGQKSVNFENMSKKAPTHTLRLAINRMIPSGRLGNTVRGRLRIYAGDTHPHQAQKPIELKIK